MSNEGRRPLILDSSLASNVLSLRKRAAERRVEAGDWVVAENLNEHFARLQAQYDDLSDRIAAARSAQEALGGALAKEIEAHRFSASELARHYNHRPSVQADFLSLLKRLEPMKARGFEKTRAGRARDGGYVMLDDFAGIEAAYSIGISDEISWDKWIVGRGIDVFQYDHTIKAAPETHEKLHWRKLGLGTSDDPDASLASLATMLAQNGHAHSHELILKIDIEDAEWDVFGALDPAITRQFRQIVGEFHRFTNVATPSRCERMRKAIVALTADHHLVHVHGNNYGPYLVMGGVPIPDSLELTFVRKDDKIFEASDEIFPTALDVPNNPALADYRLGAFRF
jgi:hypothetical protein